MTRRCRSELREGDDGKMHRYCITHNQWFWSDANPICGPSSTRQEGATMDAEKIAENHPLPPKTKLPRREGRFYVFETPFLGESGLWLIADLFLSVRHINGQTWVGVIGGGPPYQVSHSVAEVTEFVNEDQTKSA